jgi:hypothetical protein
MTKLITPQDRIEAMKKIVEYRSQLGEENFKTLSEALIGFNLSMMKKVIETARKLK